MRVYLKSNLLRTLKRPGFWIWLFIAQIPLVLPFFTMKNDLTGRPIPVFISSLIGTAFIIMIIVFYSFIFTVFVPDMKARTMDIAIGRGVSRNGIYVAKSLECIILQLINYLVTTVVCIIFAMAAGAGSMRTLYVVKQIFQSFPTLIFPMMGLAFVMIYTQNPVASVIAYTLLASDAAGILLNRILSLPGMPGIDVLRFFPVSSMDIVTKWMNMGGVIKLGYLVLAISYLVITYFISVGLFAKKELDF